MELSGFMQLLLKYKDGKKRVMINGMGSGTTRGLIQEVYDDYLVYELLSIKEEKKTSKQKQIREVKNIPIAQIVDIGEGEVTTDVVPNIIG